ncbi:MAG: peptidoglycan bridge formation glycyltransferase FemA/FemB family protein [Patescibacteria group bacterium]|jgi:lipid II:glycine glycyltransferase (peptidoglycan interpeptide bridge formation enzyme)
MEIKVVTNQAEWDGWLKNQSQCSFTQSWSWGEILISEEKKIERLQFIEGGKVCGAGQFIFNEALGFEYFFCPKGPIVKAGFVEVFTALEKYFKQKGISFLRFEPCCKNGIEDKSVYKKTIDINPRATTILELKQTEQELLEKMHSKTRYNVRLAEKKNILISEDKNFEFFWQLINETRKRDGFRLHDKRHYEEILKSPSVKQLTAMLDGKPIAVLVLISFGDTTTYLFGASDYEHRHLMAPYLLQWRAIKIAKIASSSFYDFFGIAPHKIGFSGTDYEYDENHQYAGVTRFKLGFGGTISEQPGTFDLVVSEGKYKVYEVLRKVRRIL